MNKIKYLVLVCFFFKHTCGVNRASQAALVVKNPPADAGWIPGLGRSAGGRHRQPTPVLFLGKSHGQRSLVGYSPWGTSGAAEGIAGERKQTLN